MIDPKCPICFGLGWVCENHPKRVWDEQNRCQCGAGMPCECVRADGLEEPDVSPYGDPAPQALTLIRFQDPARRPGNVARCSFSVGVNKNQT